MIVTDSHSGEVIVTPPPEIDIASGNALSERIGRACQLGPGVTVVIDFVGVTFSDSTAVTVLVHALRRLENHGCRMEIRNPTDLLRRVATTLDAAECLTIPPLEWQRSASAAYSGSGML